MRPHPKSTRAYPGAAQASCDAADIARQVRDGELIRRKATCSSFSVGHQDCAAIQCLPRWYRTSLGRLPYWAWPALGQLLWQHCFYGNISFRCRHSQSPNSVSEAVCTIAWYQSRGCTTCTAPRRLVSPISLTFQQRSPDMDPSSLEKEYQQGQGSTEDSPQSGKGKQWDRQSFAIQQP
jgi:hypothetical protein